MVRKLALAVSLALGSLPLTVYGLGLGHIKASSVLNQNFDANIDLLSVEIGELDTVRVELASHEAFTRAGVERPFFLTSLKFTTERLADGRAVIKIKSDTPVREPFLDFLVEVNWPNGRLVREYTVLLDPPTTTRRKPAKISQPVSIAQQTTTPAPAPSFSPEPETLVAGDVYGPVAGNETLWGIADSLRPQDITIQQMMMALHKSNPEAFIGNNINLLKKGQILRVPDRAAVLQFSREEATAAFRRQQEQWMADKTEITAPAPAEAASESTAAESPVAAPEQPVVETDTTPVEEPSGLLKIATARPEGEGEAGASEGKEGELAPVDAEQQLLLAREDAETARQEAEALRQHVGGLEERLKKLQRLLTLQDDHLAQLQANVAEENPELSREISEVIAMTAGEIQAESEAMSSDETATESTALTDTEQAPSDQELVEQEQVEEVNTLAEPETMVSLDQAPAAEMDDLQTTVETDASMPGSSQSWLEKNALYLGGGVAGLLLLVGFLAFRRRKNEDEDDSETLNESVLLESEPAIAAAAATALAADEDESDTSFLSEFSPEELEGLDEDTREVDPAAEADVYIAYGRYQQAEELLQNSLEKEPDRVDLKNKMLEVYHATGNKDKFVALATAMAGAGQDSDDADAWHNAKAMGRELDAGNPLFVDTSVAAADSQDEESEPAAETAEEPVDELEEFSMEGLSSIAEDDEEFENQNLSNLDVGEDDLSLDLNELAEELDSTLSDDSELLDGLDAVDLDVEDLDTDELAGDDSELLDLDIGSLDSEAEESREPASIDLDSELASENLDSQLQELDDYLESGSSEQAKDLVVEDIEVSAPDEMPDLPADLSDEDEDELDDTGMKLELAAAYVEMGDSDGARSILSEVLADGNEDQRLKANKILSELQG